MAICVGFSPTGELIQSAQSIADCTGYVLMDAIEYSETPTLQSIFAQPIAADLAELWMVGFSLPIIVYLSAWAFGVVINWFKPQPED